jgi:hypothetical protein
LVAVAGNHYFVAPDGPFWKVMSGIRTMGVYRTKPQAIGHARKLADADPPGTVLVYGADGGFEVEWTSEGDR